MATPTGGTEFLINDVTASSVGTDSALVYLEMGSSPRLGRMAAP